MNELDVPKNPAHRREWIKYQLGLRGLTLAELGRRHNVIRNTIYVAMTRPYPRMERIIAHAIGAQPQQIWPERYRPDGTPKSGKGERGIGRYRPKSSTSRVRKTDAAVA